jgi:SAM-dependent methyltransferase
MFACRSCDETSVQTVLSLGRTPLANALLTNRQLTQPEETFPLELVFCPHCTLLQITETVPPEILFRDYFYFSSFSETVLQNAHDISDDLIARCKLNSSSLVVEIASNDGYLLQNYCQRGIPVLGVEPALNIARVAQERGISTINEFFDAALARDLRASGQLADIIHANNVVAHVADLHGVVGGVAELLKPDGVAVIENHYVKDLIDKVEFDSIYHEHLCYYSATSFRNLFALHGLKMVDVEYLPIHGGSLRVFFQRDDGPCSLEKAGAHRVKALIDEESRWGVEDFAFYQNFGEKVEFLRKGLLALLSDIKAQGKSIVVYGASAKSTTLLNYFGIGKETLDYVVDRSTVKQGHYTPGTHLYICSTEKLLESQPDYVLLLTWNFVDEILAQQTEYRARGGKFIIPIPELKVV